MMTRKITSQKLLQIHVQKKAKRHDKCEEERRKKKKIAKNDSCRIPVSIAFGVYVSPYQKVEVAKSQEIIILHWWTSLQQLEGSVGWDLF